MPETVRLGYRVPRGLTVCDVKDCDREATMRVLRIMGRRSPESCVALMSYCVEHHALATRRRQNASVV